MVKKFIGGMILALSLTGCFPRQEVQEFPARGTILGRDLGYCMCCDGYLIRIDSNTYRFKTLPLQSGIQLEKETFPLAVRLAYTNDQSCSHISIQRITRDR